jgi:hypothetical protein
MTALSKISAARLPSDVLSLRTLFRGAKYQCPLGAQPIDFRFQLLQRTLAENDARRLAVIDEG